MTSRRATEAGTAISLALIPIVAERRARPGSDLTTALLGELEPDEVTLMALTLLAASHVTTANVIGTAFRSLGADRERLEILAEHPDLVGPAVDELLRWESPAQLVGRVAAQPQDLAGRHLRAGDAVLVVIGAANRDPSVYDAPDVLDLGRFARAGRPPPGLAFGHGAHACLGAALARLETTEVVRRLAGGPVWTVDRWQGAPTASFRRIRSLEVTRSAAGAPPGREVG